MNFDSMKTYIVKTPNQSFTGKANRVSFYDGRTVIDGLPETASVAEMQERIEQLRWFVNSGYSVEPKEERKARPQPVAEEVGA